MVGPKKIEVTGWTEIKKSDVTRSRKIVYRAHPDYRGRPLYHWGLFHFEDDAKPPNTTCAGMILGFIRFDTPKFPTPGLVLKYPNGNIPPLRYRLIGLLYSFEAEPRH